MDDKDSNNAKVMLYIGEDSDIDTREGWLIKTVNSYKEVIDIIESIFSN